MKKYIGWFVVLALTGCQTLSKQPVTPVESEPTNEITALPQQIDLPIETEKVSSGEPEPVVITPQQLSNIWQRIAVQLHLEVPDKAIIEQHRNWYLKYPKHLHTVSRRAAPFMHMIVEKVEARGLPLELALLPVVESAFDPLAYSHGNAAGLWQFVSATGKMYGLKQDFWYDGRRDVALATDAALDYLTYLNKRFDGNWNHAIAAYNSGSGRVSSAIRKNTKEGKPTDFFSLKLPKETSGYVPRLLALADLIANQEYYELSIPPIANQPVLTLVDPKEQLDLAIAADYAGLSIEELQSYNPAYNQWTTSPNGPHHFLVPLASADTFMNKAKQNKGKGVKVVRYKVKSGDSISTIAHRHNTSSQAIRTANNLTNDRIRSGQYLLIPRSAVAHSSYQLSNKNRPAKSGSKANKQYKLNYTVKTGDSWWKIANTYQVSSQSLAKWNGMTLKDILRPGKKLVIWQKNQKNTSRTVYYKVRSGDTISGIAYRFKVKSSDIMKWNNLNKSSYIRPGQSLKLMVDVTKVNV